jgi:hypothetical protein
MTFISRFRQFAAAHATARDKALRASANVVVNRVKRDLRGGYTSGDFVTGASINAVRATDPMWDGNVRVIRVGTTLFYNLAWEIGHHNIFTRRFERKEVWLPAFTATAGQQAATFSRVYLREMTAAGFPNDRALGGSGGGAGAEGEADASSGSASRASGRSAPGRDAHGRFVRRGGGGAP